MIVNIVRRWHGRYQYDVLDQLPIFDDPTLAVQHGIHAL
jgi:hypothetical protein